MGLVFTIVGYIISINLINVHISIIIGDVSIHHDLTCRISLLYALFPVVMPPIANSEPIVNYALTVLP